MPELRLDGASIVFLGSFNPKIFQPFWFASQGLIRPEEAENAELAVIHPEITAFNLGWVGVQVSSDRFTASTLKDPVLMRDFVLGTFHVLEHTPVRVMGMNRDLHYTVDAEDNWHRLGDRLAPKDLWRELLSNERRVGMRSLTIEGLRPGSTAQFIRIKVEPSVRVSPFGVYIQVNEQYKSDESDAGKVAPFLNVLRDAWAPMQEFATEVAGRVISESRE